jgi:hypothetical protein
MDIPVAVTLTISTAVDDEYTTDEHIRDIIEKAQSTFCLCEVQVVDSRAGQGDVLRMSGAQASRIA